MPETAPRRNARGVADVDFETFVAAILRHRDEFVEEGMADDYAAINAGLCDDLACAVSGEFGHPDNVDVMCFANFLGDGSVSEDGGPFDRELLARQWPEVAPPAGYGWDDMDALSAHFDIHPGTHVFLMHDGRTFHDAELPEGSTSFLDLPFFGRLLATWEAEGRPDLRPSAPAP